MYLRHLSPSDESEALRDELVNTNIHRPRIHMSLTVVVRNLASQQRSQLKIWASTKYIIECSHNG